MTRELVVDSSFAHYRIEGLIGRGGMGVVYRSTDLRLERTVAMKLIAPELAEDERFRFGSRFLRESRVAASLDDPGWSRSTTQASTTASSSSACVVEGQDLKVLLAGEGRLAPERALAILGHVARALDAVQQKGLVHPDVKGAGSGRASTPSATSWATVASTATATSLRPP